ncbi:peritrophin-48 [Drosophila ficusphila]|uniref:peritrophin-48 n=1 Tax=Drosophila ficusphila TaxID=30025 RepID=UPI0007E84CCD|nr:peritrophin-48 [Drosophila ficusphila]
MNDLFLVVCLVLGISSTTLAALDIASICRSSDPWQMLPHENHCQRFYVCTGDDELPFQEFSCPAEYHFSQTLRICMPGNCSNEPFVCGTSNSVERVHTDCSRYRQCLERGSFVVAKCSAGSYFDSERRACLPVAITAAHQCSCVLPENATLANPNDCETYFRCHDGQAELIQCPPGDYFEAKLSGCIPDHTGICLERPTMPPVLSEQALALDECIRTGSRLAPHSHDCRRYFVCAKQRVLEMRCPRGQYFDVVNRYCSLDFENECQDVQVKKQEQKPEKEVAQLNIPVKNKAEKEIQKQAQIEMKKELVSQEEKSASEVNAKQPSSSSEAISNYDKFSSKFISY